MSEADFPLLSFIIFLPLVGAIVVGATQNTHLAKLITLLFEG